MAGVPSSAGDIAEQLTKGRLLRADEAREHAERWGEAFWEALVLPPSTPNPSVAKVAATLLRCAEGTAGRKWIQTTQEGGVCPAERVAALLDAEVHSTVTKVAVQVLARMMTGDSDGTADGILIANQCGALKALLRKTIDVDEVIGAEAFKALALVLMANAQVGRQVTGLLTAAEDLVLHLRALTISAHEGDDIPLKVRAWKSCMRFVSADPAAAAALDGIPYMLLHRALVQGMEAEDAVLVTGVLEVTTHSARHPHCASQVLKEAGTNAPAVAGVRHAQIPELMSAQLAQGATEAHHVTPQSFRSTIWGDLVHAASALGARDEALREAAAAAVFTLLQSPEETSSKPISAMIALCDTEEGATAAIKSKSADQLLALLSAAASDHPHNALMITAVAQLFRQSIALPEEWARTLWSALQFGQHVRGAALAAMLHGWPAEGIDALDALTNIAWLCEDMLGESEELVAAISLAVTNVKDDKNRPDLISMARTALDRLRYASTNLKHPEALSEPDAVIACLQQACMKMSQVC